MKKYLLIITAVIMIASVSRAQWVITSLGETGDTVTFGTTFPGLNNSHFNGSGLDASPGVGKLDSDGWAVTGMSDGSTVWGGTYTTTNDFARGVASGGVTTGGVYAFVVASGDTAIGIQPGGSDWTPGFLIMKVVNNTGYNADNVVVSYNLIINNDQARGNYMNLYCAVNDTSASFPVSSLNDTSIAASQGSIMWVTYPKYAYFNASVANGDTLFLMWKGDDATGSGSRDEFALDNIAVEFHSDSNSSNGGLPWYPISVISTVDIDGVADSLGVQCWTSGVVLGVDLDGNAGYSFTIWDNDGINVFSSVDVDSYVVQEGDSLLIMGTVVQYNGLTEIIPDSIVLVNSGNTIPSATVITSLGESNESELIRIENMWVAAINGANIDLSDGTNTITMRIDPDTDIPGNVDFAVGDTLCFAEGIGGQFDATSPYTSGYQFFPQRASGIDNSCGSIIPPPVPFYPISLINNLDANGYPDSMGVYCWTKGVVLGVDIDGNAGYSFTLWEEEGINLFNFVDVGTYQSTEGDSLLVRGSVNFYNGLTEFTPDSIVLINSGNPVPPAKTVTILSEADESMLIRVLNVQVIDPAQWPTTFSSNVQLVTCTGDTIVMRIDTDTDIEENIPAAPTGMFSVTGIGGQYDVSSPYNEGYQIFPMYYTDIDTTTTYGAPSLIINEVLASNIADTTDENGEHDAWVELRNTSTSDINLAGLFISDNSAEPLKYMIPSNSTEVVAAMGYTLVWCDAQPSQGALHTNFTLSNSGGNVYLTSYDGCASVNNLNYPALGDDESYGYYPEGTDTLIIFPSYSTTPGAMNELIDNTNAVGVILDKNAIRIYPNPALAEQVVRFTSKLDFRVFDATGRLILSDRNSNELKLQGFNCGVYYIQADEVIMKLIVE